MEKKSGTALFLIHQKSFKLKLGRKIKKTVQNCSYRTGSKRLFVSSAPKCAFFQTFLGQHYTSSHHYSYGSRLQCWLHLHKLGDGKEFCSSCLQLCRGSCVMSRAWTKRPSWWDDSLQGRSISACSKLEGLWVFQSSQRSSRPILPFGTTSSLMARNSIWQK